MILFDGTIDSDATAPADYTFRFEDLSSVTSLEALYDIVVTASSGQVPTT